MLLSNRTIRGKVTIAPRWVGDIIGRLCNLKRVLLSCEPYGDTAQGFGTVVEVGDQIWNDVYLILYSKLDKSGKNFNYSIAFHQKGLVVW